jgi:PAS domain S-box-containing protein
MRAGAQDYISKRELVRLVPAVERELRDIETVHKRRRAEAEARDQRERARQLLDVVEVMLVALNDRGEITLLNQKASRVLGYTPQELTGVNWFERCVPAFIREGVVGAFDRLMRGEMESVEYYENPVLTRAGEERNIAWHNVLLRDEAGRITGTLSSGEDITERMKTEGALHECMALQQDLVDQIAQPFFSLDLDLRLTSWNRAAVAWAGLPAESRGEWTLEEAFPDLATSRRLREICRLVLADRECRVLPISGRPEDGRATQQVKVRPIRHGLYLLVDLDARERNEA